MRRLAKILGAVIAVYIAYLGVLMICSRLLIFPGASAGERVPAGVERLALPVDGGEVEALLLVGRGRSAESPGPAVIFAHGNAEAADDWVQPLHGYVDAGITVLIIEYRGYGRSKGSASQAALIDDAERFLALLLARPEVDGNRVVYHGRSIGSGVLSGLAARRAPRVLIVQSGFTSLRPLTREFFAPSFLLRDPFDNIDVVRELSLPVLILHGERDEVFPLSEAQALVRVARNGTLRIFACGHNDCDDDKLWAAIDAFLSRALGPG